MDTWDDLVTGWESGGPGPVPSPLCEQKSPAHQAVILSIHPEYSKKILARKKRVELRRRFPVFEQSNMTLYIYSTSPDQAIVGAAEIKEVQKLPVDQIWLKFKKQASIRKKDFIKYFQNLEFGFAIILSSIKAFPQPIPLVKLRENWGFEPPQSFLYATDHLHGELQDELYTPAK